MQPHQLVIAVGESLLDIGQADKAARIAGDRRGEILGQVAVDVVVLQHRSLDAGVVHLRDERLGAEVHVLQTRRQKLHVVILAADGPLEAAHAADAEVDVRRPPGFGRVGGVPQVAGFDDGVIAQAAHGLVAVGVYRPLLEEQVGLGVG